MRKTLKSVAGCILMLLSLLVTQVFADQVQAQLLVYRVAESGAEPYISRLLVTPELLRMDQGQGDAGYILFERKARIIYSVNPDDETILIVNPSENSLAPPDDLKLSARQVEGESIPLVAGQTPQHWEFLANGQVCRHAIVLPGVMSGATEAYSEYLDLLAYQQQTSLAAIPVEFQTPCDLAMHIYAAHSVLEKGLPLHEWDGEGRQQELVDFREGFSIPVESFQLPEGFRRVKMEKI